MNEERNAGGLALHGRSVSLRSLYVLLGYAFYRCWTYAGVHTGLLLPEGQTEFSPRDLWLYVVVGTVAALAFIVIACGVARRPLRAVRHAWAIGVFSCASTAALGVALRLEGLHVLALPLGAAFGVGSALFTVYWGIQFVRLATQSLWHVLPGAFLLGVLMIYALPALPETGGVLLTAALPLLSAACGRQAGAGGRAAPEAAPARDGSFVARHPLRLGSIPALFLYISLVFGFSMGYMRGIGVGGDYAVSEFYEFILVAVFMAGLVAFEAARHAVPDEGGLYRAVSFAMVIAVLAFSLSPLKYISWVFSLVMGCFEVFLIVWWVVVTRYARLGGTSPGVVFATGRLAIVLGMLLGSVYGSALGISQSVAPLGVGLLLVSAIAILTDPGRLFGERPLPSEEDVGGEEGGAPAEGPGPRRRPARDAEGSDAMAAMSEARGLTRRETDVAALLVQGYNAASIARKLTLSENTVKTHIKNIYRKCSVSGQQELIEEFHRPR